jgi:hypothetical protein
MKFIRIFFLFLVITLTQNTLLAQGNAGPPKKDQSIKSKRKQRKEDKRKWKEERKKKRDEEKMIREHHKRIQTKEVRKRMKRSKKTAQRNHDHTRAPWYERIFNKPGKGKRSKAPKEKSQKVKQN